MFFNIPKDVPCNIFGIPDLDAWEKMIFDKYFSDLDAVWEERGRIQDKRNSELKQSWALRFKVLSQPNNKVGV